MGALDGKGNSKVTGKMISSDNIQQHVFFVNHLAYGQQENLLVTHIYTLFPVNVVIPVRTLAPEFHYLYDVIFGMERKIIS